MKQYFLYLSIVVLACIVSSCQTTGHLKLESDYERSLISMLKTVDSSYYEDVMLRELYLASVNRMYSLLNSRGIPFEASDKQRYLERYPITLDNYLPWIRDIVNQYADIANNRIDKDLLIESAIAGVADSLNSGTRYYTANEMRERKEFNMFKKKVDSGLRVRELKQSIYILFVHQNSPASKAGIKAGGYIHAVDGKAVDKYSSGVVKKYLQGEAGKSIDLLITPPGGIKKRRYTVKLEPYDYSTLSWFVNDEGLGIITLYSLARNTSVLISDIEKSMKDQSKVGVRQLVLDLRDNSGGVVSEVVDIADLFLTKGRILMTNNGTKLSFNARESEIFKDTRIVILVNSYTASGAEILARSLQYHNRAVVIGYITQGEGNLFTYYDLENGGRLMLATGQLYYPDGEVVNGNGVQPDICANISFKKKKCSKNPGEDPEAENQLIIKTLRKHVS